MTCHSQSESSGRTQFYTTRVQLVKAGDSTRSAVTTVSVIKLHRVIPSAQRVRSEIDVLMAGSRPTRLVSFQTSTATVTVRLEILRDVEFFLQCSQK